MQIKYTVDARNDLRAIKRYITKHNPDAAEKVARKIILQTEKLATFALMGREGRVEGTRELSISAYPYVVVYRLVDDETISVGRILHTRQLYPPAP